MAGRGSAGGAGAGAGAGAGTGAPVGALAGGIAGAAAALSGAGSAARMCGKDSVGAAAIESGWIRGVGPVEGVGTAAAGAPGGRVGRRGVGRVAAAGARLSVGRRTGARTAESDSAVSTESTGASTGADPGAGARAGGCGGAGVGPGTSTAAPYGAGRRSNAPPTTSAASAPSAANSGQRRLSRPAGHGVANAHRGGRRGAPARGADGVEHVHDVARALWPVGGALGQALVDQGGEHRRHGGPPALDRLRIFHHLRRENGLRGAPREGRLAGQHLVGHDAERVEIGPVVDLRAGGGLFGRHVHRRPQGHAERGDAAGPLDVRAGADRLGHPEVRHHRHAARQEHVVRLHVPVHHPARVRVRQRETTSRRMRTVSEIGSSPSRVTRARSDSPTTNGMMK